MAKSSDLTGFGSAALAVCALAAWACGEQPVEREPVARPVKLLSLGAGGVAQTLEFPGTVEAAREVEMGFEVPGRVAELPVLEGQRLAAGAVLARLDARDYESALSAETARRAAAQAEYDRQRALFEADAAPEQELEKAQRNYEVAASREESARKAVDDATLRAPFDGIVARKLIDDLANVQAKQPVLVFQDDSSLEVAIDVPERIMVGGQADLSHEERTARLSPRVIPTSMADAAIPARFTEIAATADPATRTFEAHLAFDPPAGANIRPGMTATVHMSVPVDAPQARGGFAIPAQAALADEGGGAFVWKVDPDTMRVSRAPVTLGELVGSDVVVESGLAGGDTIAITGVHQLREGMQVRRLED